MARWCSSTRWSASRPTFAPTNDIVLVVDLRVEPAALEHTHDVLARAGFSQDLPSPEGVTRIATDAAGQPSTFLPPTTWAQGERVIPTAHGRRLADVLGGRDLVALNDGYTLVPVDHPSILAKTIRTFLRT